ncbi:antitoxin of the YeeV-YeeU toxin-antitoxin system [Escherichia coli]|nr:antitoxin of the YeeV-YeeU toxin-antitoxin system [Escherichia coli]
MSRIITTTVYTLDELSCPAREKARDGYRQHHADSNWYENVYEDFREVCDIFGVNLRQRVFRLSKPGEGYRYCGAVHDFHVPALSDADVQRW